MNNQELQETKEIEDLIRTHLCYHDQLNQKLNECKTTLETTNGNGWLRRLIERFADVGKTKRSRRT